MIQFIATSVYVEISNKYTTVDKGPEVIIYTDDWDKAYTMFEKYIRDEIYRNHLEDTEDETELKTYEELIEEHIIVTENEGLGYDSGYIMYICPISEMKAIGKKPQRSVRDHINKHLNK